MSCVHTYKHKDVHVCIYIREYVDVYTNVCSLAFTCGFIVTIVPCMQLFNLKETNFTHACAYMCIYVCVCVYIYIYVHVCACDIMHVARIVPWQKIVFRTLSFAPATSET